VHCRRSHHGTTPRYLAALDPKVSAQDPEGIQEFRRAAEAALAAAGLHLAEAHALWQEYRYHGLTHASHEQHLVPSGSFVWVQRLACQLLFKGAAYLPGVMDDRHATVHVVDSAARAMMGKAAFGHHGCTSQPPGLITAPQKLKAAAHFAPAGVTV